MTPAPSNTKPIIPMNGWFLPTANMANTMNPGSTVRAQVRFHTRRIFCIRRSNSITRSFEQSCAIPIALGSPVIYRSAFVDINIRKGRRSFKPCVFGTWAELTPSSRRKSNRFGKNLSAYSRPNLTSDRPLLIVESVRIDRAERSINQSGGMAGSCVLKKGHRCAARSPVPLSSCILMCFTQGVELSAFFQVEKDIPRRETNDF